MGQPHQSPHSFDLERAPRPPKPRRTNPAIALIGCGDISRRQLAAYCAAGFRIAALCDVREERARARLTFYPDAAVYTDHRALLADDEIEIVDVATHPHVRVPLIEDALRAGKHVISQKPFVLELDEGERLADLADEMNVKLAVHQSGRWAPHYSYIRQVIGAGAIGEVNSVTNTQQFDHNWIKDTHFNQIHHVMLFDYGIHWFDMIVTLFGHKAPRCVHASVSLSGGQWAKPPLLAQAMVELEYGQATLAFDGNARLAPQDQTTVVGSKGVIRSVGPSMHEQSVVLHTEEGTVTPALTGTWLREGFQGTMGELLCAIEEDREPSHSARNNLRSLALCFAAVHSADTGLAQDPSQIRALPNPGRVLGQE